MDLTSQCTTEACHTRCPPHLQEDIARSKARKDFESIYLRSYQRYLYFYKNELKLHVLIHVHKQAQASWTPGRVLLRRPIAATQAASLEARLTMRSSHSDGSHPGHRSDPGKWLTLLFIHTHPTVRPASQSPDPCTAAFPVVPADHQMC